MSGIIFTAIVFALLFAFLTGYGAPQFRYDRNPHRRFCRTCDQQQDFITWVGHHHGWWENIAPIKDPKCKCHEYTK